MKKLTAVIILLSVACVSVSAQFKKDPEAVKMLNSDLTLAGINLHPYIFYPIIDTPAPRGYKPFYVSHYGRHGTRSSFDNGSYAQLVKTLEAARDAGILSAEGQAALEEAAYVDSCHNGMSGRLTQRGVREHAAIAERLYRRVPSVFRKDAKIRAVSSTTPRCIVSMVGFTNSLSRLNPKLQIFPDTGEKYMKYISDCGDRKAMLNYFQPRIDSLSATMPYDTSYVFSRLFTDVEAAREIVGDPGTFNDNLVKIGVVAQNFDYKDCILPCLPFDLIYSKWSFSNHRMYAMACNTVEKGAERITEAEALVNDIVSKADEAIAGGEYAVDLRFGHDFPFLVLTGYLGIEGTGDKLSFDEIDEHWNAAFRTPMASNLQMIFYRNKAGDVLVKFLVQEQEVRLRGLEPLCGPYYRWSDVKSNTKGYLR